MLRGIVQSGGALTQSVVLGKELGSATLAACVMAGYKINIELYFHFLPFPLKGKHPL